MAKITDEHHLLAIKNRVKLLQKPTSQYKLTGLTLTHLKTRKKKNLTILLIAISTLIFLMVFWFFYNLTPIKSGSDEAVLFNIQKGSTPNQIATNLEKSGLIRSSLVFNIYTQFNSSRDKLKAGNYKIYKHDSLPKIVDLIVTGKGTEMSIMFLPGYNLMDIKSKVLLKNGFTTEQIDEAFSVEYEHPLLKIKPKANDIEGFIYGDTYNFAADSDIKTIFNKTFDEFQQVIEKNNLEYQFKSQGLTLYEGIILASIVQKEVIASTSDIPTNDQKTVAGIFYNRLRLGMTLGSDVTYQYIADKLGLVRDPKLDNPYNTRKYVGLPPGPIASPGLTALLAVARPIDTNYYYFLSGDDGKTYYAVNASEHQENISRYCKVACSKL